MATHTGDRVNTITLSTKDDIILQKHRITDAVSLHNHEFVEIAYIAEGRGFHGVAEDADRQVSPIQTGDLIMLNSHISHWYSADRESPLIIYNCIFDSNILNYSSEANDNFVNIIYNFLFPQNPASMQTDQFILIHNALCVSGILKEMVDEYTNAMDGYIQANRANLIRLLIAIFRQYKNMRSSKLGNTNYYQSIVESSIAFMQEYYAQNITCQTLSSRVYLSDGYLNKIFKKITGESPLHFLQSIRITKAAELLLSTSLPIATVASRVGYADMKYFIKLSNVKTDLPHRRKSPVRKKRLHFRRKRGILISFHGR